MSDSVSFDAGVSQALTALGTSGSATGAAASLAVLKSALQMEAELMNAVLAMLGVGQNVNTTA